MKTHWTYFLYIIFWETLTIGGSGYAVFGLGRSGWWLVLGIIMSGSGYHPSSWAKLNSKPKP